APGKRKVKPVPSSRVQVNFDGLDDSEEDSDFDINKHSQDDDAESDSDEVDDGEIDDKYAAKENLQRHVEERENLSENDEEDDDSEADSSESETEPEGENMEELNTDDDNDDDEEEEEDGSEDGRGNNHSESPEIKGMFSLGHAWDMIDSDEDDEDYVPRKRKKKSAKTGDKPENLPASADLPKDDSMAVQILAPHERIKVLVCCVCLSDRSADDDEIVECDNCGVSVHEGCYGISESHSTASTESSASTEPWFCDACKANLKP
ncbi:unnamed protein product, partial [Candidula unifasciata]